MNKRNRMGAVNAGGRKPGNDFSVEDQYFLELMRHKMSTDFSLESKIREPLRERLVNRFENRTDRHNRIASLLFAGYHLYRRTAWAGMAVVLFLLLGLAMKNLDVQSSLTAPGHATTFLPGTLSSATIPATTRSATQPLSLIPEQAATPGGPTITLAPQFSNSSFSMPAVSPVSIPSPRQ